MPEINDAPGGAGLTGRIRAVAIVGGGTMGAGIAVTSVLAGIPTVLIDPAAAALERAAARLESQLARQVGKGRLDAAGAAAARARLSLASDLEAAAAADLAIEAVFERRDVKHAVLGRLEPLLAPECLIATNTSCLPVSELAEALARPERFLGLHYFSPVEANPLVEVVEGAATRPGLGAELGAFLAATGRVALPCRDRPGFAINRFFCPFVNEAFRCLGEGLGTAGQIDAVARGLFGQPLGPIATTALVGPAVMFHAVANLGHLGPTYAPAPLLERLASAGEGVAPEEEAPPLPPGLAEAIADRLRGALYLPLSELLDEAVAAGADVDRGAAIALRFGVPPARTLEEDPRAPALVAARRAALA